MKSTIFYLLLIAAFFSTFYFGLKIKAHSIAESNVFPPPLISLAPQMLKLLTLGHHSLYEDIVLMSYVQNVGDKNLLAKEKEAIIKLITKIAKQHIRIENFYMLSCFIFIQDFQIPEQCEDIIKEGLIALPHNWQIPFTQAYVENSILKNTTKATIYFQLVARHPEAPQYISGLVEKLKAKESLTNEQLYQLSQDVLPQGVKEVLEKKADANN